MRARFLLLVLAGLMMALTSAGTYTVVSGDTLSSIAQKLGTTVAALVSANSISDPNSIYPGEVLNY